MAASRYMEQGYKAQNQRYLLAAINFFRKALRETPHNDEAYAAIGTCYLLGKKYKEARENLEEALRINPRNASALENMALVYKSLGDHLKAAEYEKEVARLAKEKVHPGTSESNIEIIARRKKGEDSKILACPFCGSLFFRDNIHAWLNEYGRCPTCNRVLLQKQLIGKDWNTYKNERCAIDMIRFDMKR